jgi:hypothetical protein
MEIVLCVECIYFDETTPPHHKEAGMDYREGECRRRAPEPMRPNVLNATAQSDDDHRFAEWPRVLADEFCGEGYKYNKSLDTSAKDKRGD